ncbi:ABC transporter ATP-binding protein [Candidatus Geothermarchaeota archaeon]|nr:MAG: ABC transporter ATP-binding protein [Candidatus Geothermarchaeota archaeon]
MGKPIIRLENIWMLYQGEYILEDVNLDVYKGDSIHIYGRSGVGKTSLLKVMALLSKPSKGRIYLFNRDVTELNEDEKAVYRAKYYGILIQGDILIPTLTVYENLDLVLRIKGFNEKVRRDMIIDALNMLGMEKYLDRYPDGLSAGERQRIMIARAIVSKPEILLLDEPHAYLDNENTLRVLNILQRLNKEDGTTIIFTTTDAEVGIGDYFRKYYIIEENKIVKRV